MRVGKLRRLAQGVLAGALAASVASMMLPSAQARTGTDPQFRSVDGTATVAERDRRTESYRSVPGEVLVRYSADTSAPRRAELRAAVDATLDERLPVRGLELLQVDGGVHAAVETLDGRPDVMYAEPNYVYRTSATTTDPRSNELWGLHNTGQVVLGHAGTPDADIDAPEAWNSLTSRRTATVAVVDTGVAYDHPDLAANMWSNPTETVNGVDDDDNGYVDDVRGWDWSGLDNDPQDLDGHGTHVAGTIGAVADNGTGLAGVAPDVSLMPLRVLDATGSGTTADIIEAFAYAAAEGADVVNASLGGPSYSQAMADVIARSTGTLFVVAAGNEATNNEAVPSYPCNYPAANLVCVAATDNNDRLASFSNYGSTAVDLAAPGVGILSAAPPAETTVWSDDFNRLGLGARWATGGTAGWGIESDETGPFASDSPSRSYAPYANSWIRTTSPLDLSGLRGCTLGYWLKLDTEDGYDGLLVEASTDTTTWTTLTGWSGYSGGWQWMEDSLEQFDGADSLYLRYRLVSDDTYQYDGAGIDDVEVRCTAGGYDGDEYAYMQGTSMATPHVAGAAALLRSAAPGASVTDLRNAILGGVEAKASLASATVTGGRLNVMRSLDVLVPSLRFGSGSYAVAENNGSATVTVQRTGDLSAPASVSYNTSDGSATAGSDYAATAGTLSFAADQSTATFSVPVTDDGSFEPDETLALTLSSPTGGLVLGTPATATVTISNDDQPASVRFQSLSRTAAENVRVVDLTVTRNGNTAVPASVDYRRTSGTATSGQDFVLPAGTLHFDAGETTKTVPVTVGNDTTRESAETIVVSLSPNDTATTVEGSGSTTLTIAPSDQQPDAVVSTARTSGYVGGNTYNTDATGQTATLRARRTDTRTLYVRMYNDGNVTNTFTIRGSAAQSGSRVTYLAGSTDISQAMRSTAGWKVRLAPHAYRLITVRLGILTGAAIGSTKAATVRGTWSGDGDRVDVAKARVAVIR
jgi:thermitase